MCMVWAFNWFWILFSCLPPDFLHTPDIMILHACTTICRQYFVGNESFVLFSLDFLAPLPSKQHSSVGFESLLFVGWTFYSIVLKGDLGAAPHSWPRRISDALGLSQFFPNKGDDWCYFFSLGTFFGFFKFDKNLPKKRSFFFRSFFFFLKEMILFFSLMTTLWCSCSSQLFYTFFFLRVAILIIFRLIFVG